MRVVIQYLVTHQQMFNTDVIYIVLKWSPNYFNSFKELQNPLRYYKTREE